MFCTVALMILNPFLAATDQRVKPRYDLARALAIRYDGYFEYSAVATNKSLTVQRLWYFAAGRDGQEKTFAELRSQFALDVVPTKSYAANSAWQQLNVLQGGPLHLESSNKSDGRAKRRG